MHKALESADLSMSNNLCVLLIYTHPKFFLLTFWAENMFFSFKYSFRGKKIPRFSLLKNSEIILNFTKNRGDSSCSNTSSPLESAQKTRFQNQLASVPFVFIIFVELFLKIVLFSICPINQIFSIQHSMSIIILRIFHISYRGLKTRIPSVAHLYNSFCYFWDKLMGANYASM